jgi:hypothetical protein
MIKLFFSKLNIWNDLESIIQIGIAEE